MDTRPPVRGSEELPEPKEEEEVEKEVEGGKEGGSSPVS